MFLQTDQRPRRERVQLQEVWQRASQAAPAESKCLHPGRPAAHLLQVRDVIQTFRSQSRLVDDGIKGKNPPLVIDF